jgi:hypothetical protein
MPLGHTTRLLGVNDAAIYKMLTDVAASAPTYASKVDVVGVKSLECSLEIDTKELRGDNTLLAADSVMKRISGTLAYAKHGFDVWGAALSSAAADSGTTPNMKTTYDIVQTTLPASVKIEAQTKQVDYVGGDVHIILWKCAPNTMPFGFMEEDYRTQSFGFVSMPVIGTPATAPANAWAQIVGNETAVAIS